MALALLGLVFVALAVSALALRARKASRAASGWTPRIQDDRALAGALKKIAARRELPAMAAALVRGAAIVARAAVGSTVAGGDRPVDLQSRFHLGSTTKGLTALLIASLVREGRLRYDATLGSVLPHLPMRDVYGPVTVRDLLLHRAGVMAMQDTRHEDPVASRTLWFELPAQVPDPQRQRLEMAKLVLDLPPLAPAGTKHVYSNMGYAILGLIAETVAGESFESLLERRIFARIVVFPALDAAFVAATTTGAGARAIGEAIEAVTGFEWQ